MFTFFKGKNEKLKKQIGSHDVKKQKRKKAEQTTPPKYPSFS